MSRNLEVDTRAISEMFGSEIEKIITWTVPNKYTVWYKFEKQDENDVTAIERRSTTLDDAELCDLMENAIFCYFGDFDLRFGNPCEVIICDTSKDDGSQTNVKEYKFSNLTKLRVYCDVLNSDFFKKEVALHYEANLNKIEQDTELIKKLFENLPREKQNEVVASLNK